MSNTIQTHSLTLLFPSKISSDSLSKLNTSSPCIPLTHQWWRHSLNLCPIHSPLLSIPTSSSTLTSLKFRLLCINSKWWWEESLALSPTWTTQWSRMTGKGWTWCRVTITLTPNNRLLRPIATTHSTSWTSKTLDHRIINSNLENFLNFNESTCNNQYNYF